MMNIKPCSELFKGGFLRTGVLEEKGQSRRQRSSIPFNAGPRHVSPLDVGARIHGKNTIDELDLLLPGAACEEDQEGKQLPEGDAPPPAHQVEHLLRKRNRHRFSKDIMKERLV